jgi:hypothetical protein
MNTRRLVAALVVLFAAVACRNNERSMITGSYGSGAVSGEVFMVSTMTNGSPAGVEVSVKGTGMAMVLGDDGRFAFTAVPENAILGFRRAADGIDATTKVNAASMSIELAWNIARSGGRHRAAPIAPLLEFEGTLKTVATDSIVVHTSFNTDVTVHLAAETVIRKGQTPVLPADLKVGDRVHVKTTLKDTVYTATEVIVQNDGADGAGDAAQSVTANGLVASIGTADMVVHTADGRDVTVQVDTKTLIRKYGQIIDFSAIKVGNHVEARGTAVDASTIKAVQIEVEDAPGQHGAAVVDGTVSDVGTSSLTLHSDAGDLTVNIDGSTTIKKAGKTIPLSGVHSGDEVSVKGSWVDAHTILAQSIQVQGGH